MPRRAPTKLPFGAFARHQLIARNRVRETPERLPCLVQRPCRHPALGASALAGGPRNVDQRDSDTVRAVEYRGCRRLLQREQVQDGEIIDMHARSAVLPVADITRNSMLLHEPYIIIVAHA